MKVEVKAKVRVVMMVAVALVVIWLSNANFQLRLSKLICAQIRTTCNAPIRLRIDSKFEIFSLALTV